MFSRAALLCLLVGAALLSAPRSLRAHDVQGTVIYVDLGHSSVHLDIEIPIDELRLAYGLSSHPGMAELPATAQEISEYLLAHLQLRSAGGAPFSLVARPREQLVHDARNWQRVDVEATPPAGVSTRDLVLETDVIDHRVISHRVYVFLRRDVEGGRLGDPELLEVLHYQSHHVRVQSGPGSLAVALAATFRLGMSHIAEGSDHLLFLFTLLLPACLSLAGKRWGARRSAGEAGWDVARIVTAFTVGHSVTLLVGALGVMRTSPTLVESLIALSVLASALHALVPIFPRREAWVALAFGLVHGLGFASALEGLGVDGSTLLLSVLGFNLGVEVMQALLVVAILPWLFVLQGTRFAWLSRTAGGGLAVAVALAWFGERAFGVTTALPRWVEGGLANGPWLVFALAAFALLAQRYGARSLAAR